MEEWNTSHPTDFFYFQLATQEREVEEDNGKHPDNVAPSEEDNILYTEGEQAVMDDATTLLFIHQSEQQLQILKRSD